MLMSELNLLLLTINNEIELEKSVKSVYSQWAVECCITKELISLNDLSYWDVEKQIAFSSPYLIPENQTDSYKQGYYEGLIRLRNHKGYIASLTDEQLQAIIEAETNLETNILCGDPNDPLFDSDELDELDDLNELNETMDEDI